MKVCAGAAESHSGSRGVPRSIGIDGRRMVADDEITYRVPKFWRGTKGRGGPDAPGPTAR